MDTNGQNVTWATALTSSSATLTKSGSGTLSLTGANTYSGTTSINSGTLQIGSGGTAGSFGTGAVVNNSTLAFNRSNALSCSNVISGTGNVIQSGAGLLTLSGSSTFSGDVLISSGTVSANLNGDTTNPTRGALGNPAAVHTVTVQNGATLLFAQANVFGNSISTINTALVVDGGMVSYADNGLREETLGLVTLKNGATLNSINGGIVGYQAYALTNTVTVTGTAPSQITTSGTVNIGDNLQGTITFAVDATGGSGADLTISAPLLNKAGGAGAGSLIKTGSGTLALAASNSYTGGTTVNSGVLQIGQGGTTGSLASASAVTGSSGATLVFNRSDSATVSNTITGGLAVRQSGAGTLILSGSNSHNGGTTVNNGTLQLGNANALGANTGALNMNGGTLDLHGYSTNVGVLSGSSGASVTNTVSGTSTLATTMASGTSTFAGNIANGAGAVALTKEGTGKLILSGSLSMAGLNANNGVVELAQSGSIGAVTVSGSGAMALTAHSGSTYTVLDTSSLSITSGGSIDLWNNALILRASGTSENATNLTAVKASVNAASDGLKWDGVGLGSTTAYNEAQPTHTQALALMVYDNSVIKQGSFEGVSGLGYFDGETPVGFNQVLVKLTYLGDFNADGMVNASDYTWLDGYALGANVLGDLNGDGIVNATDYTWLDGSALNQSFGVLAAQPSGSGAQPLSPMTAAAPTTTALIAASPEAVPEPGALGMLITGALGLLGFRRKGKRSIR